MCVCMYVCSSSSSSGSGSGMIADQYEAQEDTVWAPVMGEARAVKQSYPWRLRLRVCIVLGMAAAVFLVVGLSRQAPGIVSEGDDYDTTAVLSLLEWKNNEKLRLAVASLNRS